MRQAVLAAILTMSFSYGAYAQNSGGTSSPGDFITRQNAPLGLTLAEAGKKLPICRFDSNNLDENMGYDLEPITGYLPVFTDLLPTYDDSILTTSKGTLDAKQTLSNGQLPTIDDGTLTYIRAICGDPDDTSVPLYIFVLYNSKIMIVQKGISDPNGRSANDEMNVLLPSLAGNPGPVHQAVSIDHGEQVDVTYADQGNERTILETEDSFSMGDLGTSSGGIDIAYVDLSLWKTFSDDEVSKMKVAADQGTANNINATNNIKNGL